MHDTPPSTAMPSPGGRTTAARPVIATLLLVRMTVITAQLPAEPRAAAVTTGNGAVVYSPPAGSAFNPEGGRAAGTTYAKVITLKNNGTSNGTQLATFDKVVLSNGIQTYPIHRSTDNDATWTCFARHFPGCHGAATGDKPSFWRTPLMTWRESAGH